VAAVPITYYRPSVEVGDKSIVCEHKFIHETEKMAMACGRMMARAGLTHGR
jgi:hypothetical protein